MSIFTSIKNWFSRYQAARRYRFPALAEANKVLFVLENEVVQSQLISRQIEQYKDAQSLPERDRDLAFIPIYFGLEAFIIEHQPPVIKEALNKDQLREKVRQNVNVEQLNEMFRLIFLPPNRQLDHLLKIGTYDLLMFLLTSLGSVQLQSLVQEASAGTGLQEIQVTEDGVNFDKVHKEFESTDVSEVQKAYKSFYARLIHEITSEFGQKATTDLVSQIKRKIETTYDDDLVSLFLDVLPEEVGGAATPNKA